MALQLGNGLGEFERSSHETDAPPRHGVGFRHAVDHGNPVFHAGARGDRGMLADIVDVLVDFVGNNEHLRVAAEHFGQSFHFFGAIDGTGGVGGAAKDESTGAGGDGGLELCGRDLEILLDLGFHKHGGAVGQAHHVGVAHPIGGGDDDFIAFAHHRKEHAANGLLGSVPHHDLCGRIFEVVLTKQLAADGFAQVEIAGHGAIARPVVVDGLFGRGFDVIGGVEIRFSDAEIDDVDALCFEFGALLRHGQGGGGRKTVETGGKLHDAVKN